MPSVNASLVEGPTKKVEVRVMHALKAESAVLGTCEWRATSPGPKNSPGSGSRSRSQTFASLIFVARSLGEMARGGGGAADR